MNSRVRYAGVLLSLSMLAIPWRAADGQPDPCLNFPWDCPFFYYPTNPGGARAVPKVMYNPATGILSVDTRGLDGISNTPTNTGVIQGDDVGMIELIVTGPAATRLLHPFNLSFDPDSGIGWSSQYFAGRAQLIGTVLIGQYVPPGVYDVFEYPSGTQLVGNAYEMVVNFAPGAPGAIANSSVVLIPEPGSLGLTSAMLLGLLFAARRGG